MIHEILTNPDVLAAFHTLVLAVIVAATGLVTSAAVRWTNINISSRQIELIAEAARMAVLYAEQTGLGKTGEEKFAVAAQAIDAFLAAHNIPVTAEEIRAAIEAAVKEHLPS